MQNLAGFFAMGGYAVYVWPAFLVALLVMGGQLATTLRTLHRREAALAALEVRQGASRRSQESRRGAK
jgi:heme exporter protein D